MIKRDARKCRDTKVTKKTFSFKMKNPELWFLFHIYSIRHKKEFTKGEYIENLLKNDLKSKKEKRELDDIPKKFLDVLDEE